MKEKIEKLVKSCGTHKNEYIILDYPKGSSIILGSSRERGKAGVSEER